MGYNGWLDRDLYNDQRKGWFHFDEKIFIMKHHFMGYWLCEDY